MAPREGPFSWDGWSEGETDCDPPEPGKEWLTIRDRGEEIAVIVLRSAALASEEALVDARQKREQDADLIVAALNRIGDDGDSTWKQAWRE